MSSTPTPYEKLTRDQKNLVDVVIAIEINRGVLGSAPDKITARRTYLAERGDPFNSGFRLWIEEHRAHFLAEAEERGISPNDPLSFLRHVESEERNERKR